MNKSSRKLRFLLAAALLFLAAQRPSLAGSSTWATNPTSGNWNTPANWRPQRVPNSTTDIATFGVSHVTDVTNADTIVNLDSLVFSPGAPQYTINASDNIELYGTGVVNNSGAVQSFVAFAIFFKNSATAGEMVNFATLSGSFFFENASSAGSATFNLTSGDSQATILFEDSSTAGNATINASASSMIAFLDSSTGGSSILNLRTAAFVSFAGSNNAEQMIGTCIGGNEAFASQIDFEGFSSAGEGTFTAIGGSTSGEKGGFILFDNTATADNATFIINGAMGAGLTGTELFFSDITTAANATITAKGGVDGSAGGVIMFRDKSKGGTCSITLKGNAELDLRAHKAPGLTIGSLSGAGSVLLGANTLTMGSNNQSTTFSGVIQDGGIQQDSDGSLSKLGTGVLKLSGANTYTGGTTLSSGGLVINNRSDSGTGPGPVQVKGGTLAGAGVIAGAVTIGTGSGAGAVLAPGMDLARPITLTIQSSLTFKADATYKYRLNLKKAKADQVIAKGVTIESGGQFDFQPAGRGRLRAGKVATVINNTSANPIAGTFANLPDGAILSVGGNKLQASYEGGDGNDLTLTVVP